MWLKINLTKPKLRQVLRSAWYIYNYKLNSQACIKVYGRSLELMN